MMLQRLQLMGILSRQTLMLQQQPTPLLEHAIWGYARTIAFLISDIKDRAGNTITNITASTDGTSVTFDSIDPTLQELLLNQIMISVVQGQKLVML